MAERFSRFHEVRDYQGKGVDVYDDNLIELEQSSLAEPITQDNLGYQLLLRHGWKSGQGLGKNEQAALLDELEGMFIMGSSEQHCKVLQAGGEL
ncbi:hypothetical protein MTO96_008277 [Rhipicephalus appendiculatus]